MIAESELILNKDGSIYHLGLQPEDLADTILVVGDPSRVGAISQYFDSVEFKLSRREFVTHTGYVGKKRVTVISSGMGTDNVEILMTELDILVNVDLQRREEKPERKELNIIRIGTSGSLQADVPIDSHLVAASAIGLDTLMSFYQLPQTNWQHTISQQLQQALGLSFQPCCVEASQALQTQFGFDFIAGNTVTCPGFYAPQGRKIRLPLKISDLVKKLNNFQANTYRLDDFDTRVSTIYRLTNFEMETAGYYTLGSLLGHQVISLNAIVVNRITSQFSKNADNVIDQLIKKVLERV